MKHRKTPYFIFNPKTLSDNYKSFEALAKKHLKKFMIAYSVKTNSLKPVIQTLTNLNSNFEVASIREINLVKKKGLIFNSPCKTPIELKIALNNKFLINIDSLQEIDKIHKLTKNKKLNIGLRVSLKESKFGFSSKKLNEVIKYAKSKNLIPVALHFHSGTNLTLKKYTENLNEIKKFLEKLKLPSLKFINLGGGFPDKSQLKNLNATLEDYFQAIKTTLKKFIPKKTIILEPGRALVSDTMELITRVHYIKKSENTNYAILDAGINILPKITFAQYRFSKIKNQKSKNQELKKQEYLLSGPLLFSNDTMGKFQSNLEQGDLIKVENTGAYCYNLAWEISYKKPKVFVKK